MTVPQLESSLLDVPAAVDRIDRRAIRQGRSGLTPDELLNSGRTAGQQRPGLRWRDAEPVDRVGAGWERAAKRPGGRGVMACDHLTISAPPLLLICSSDATNAGVS